MRPELFMRKERDAIDLFAAFLNVGSMQATQANFGKLRKVLDKAAKRAMKEVRMKRMSGVSVGRHPFFQERGSYDGEKMVVARRISFDQEGMGRYDDVARFVKRLGFKEKAMAITARGTNNRGRIEELDYDRNVTHSDMSDVVGRKVARELLGLAREIVGRSGGTLGIEDALVALGERDALGDFDIGYEAEPRERATRRGPGSPGGVVDVWLEDRSDDVRLSWRDLERVGGPGPAQEKDLEGRSGRTTLLVGTNFGPIPMETRYKVTRVGRGGVVVRLAPELGDELLDVVEERLR